MTAEQVKKNYDLYGPNILFPKKADSEIWKFLTHLLMGLNLLLWICGVISVVTFFMQLATAGAGDGVDFDNVKIFCHGKFG